VTFATWAEAEAALAGVNGKLTLPGSAHPVAVKFADAKPGELAKFEARGGTKRVGSELGIAAAAAAAAGGVMAVGAAGPSSSNPGGGASAPAGSSGYPSSAGGSGHPSSAGGSYPSRPSGSSSSSGNGKHGRGGVVSRL